MISYCGNVHLCLTHQRKGGCQWRQEKGLVGLIWPLLQMSSLSEVYSFSLVHIIQKHLQTIPDFRGQATKSLASSDPECSRVVNWRPVLCCCHCQQGCSERQSSPPRCPLSSGTGIWEIWAHSQAMGSSYKQLPVCAVVLCKAELWAAVLKRFLGKQCRLATSLELLWLQYNTMCALVKWQLPSSKAEVMAINARDPFCTDNAIKNNIHAAHKSSTESTVPGFTFRVLTLTWGL